MSEHAPPHLGPQAGDPASHITINMILLYIGGGLIMFGGLVAFMATMVAGEFVSRYDDSGAAEFWINFGGTIALMSALLIGLPAILAAIGLGKRAEWGRVLALVVAGLNGLMGLTLLGGNVVAVLNIGWAVYAFITLLDARVVELFRAGGAPQ